MTDIVENNTHKWWFHGLAKEYFGIWLSNLFLSIITLGIYSAWAKVRRNRYLMGNTEIAGSALQYHATGGQIFIGRCIATILLALYSYIPQFVPELLIPIILLLIILMPWIIDRSMSFRCRVVSWHNIHFRWVGSYRAVAKGLLPLIITFTPYILASLYFALQLEKLGKPSNEAEIDAFMSALLPVYGAMFFAFILYPFAARSFAVTIVNNITWGSLKLKNLVSMKSYSLSVILYLYLVQFILTVFAGFIIGFIIAIIVAVSQGNSIASSFDPLEFIGPIIAFSLLMILLMVPAYKAYRIMMRALTMNNTQAYDHKNAEKPVVYFHAKYTWWKAIRLEMGNLFATIFSLLLLTPWATIRREKYLIENSAVTFTIDPEMMVDEQHELVSSMASEYADMDGFDFSPW